MSRLEIAAERLSKALDSLDRAAEPLLAARAAAASAQDEVLRLNAERDSLLARIATLEDEARALGEISEEVEDRLDGAISEIRTALGR